MRNIPATDLVVHPLCLGGNVFGWTADEAESFAVLDAYVAAGGNFVDTADGYSQWVPGHRGGESEEIVGRWMAARGTRGQIVVATKVGSKADRKAWAPTTCASRPRSRCSACRPIASTCCTRIATTR